MSLLHAAHDQAAAGPGPFDAVNIWADPDAAAVVRSVNDGDELVPTVRVGSDRYLSNPRYREVRAAMAGD